MKHFVIAALATFGIVLSTAPAARADTSCSNETVTGGTINGNLVVKPGGTGCTLNADVTVTGNVRVQPNASLTIYAPPFLGTVVIDGNVSVGQGASANIFGAIIGGNISVGQGASVGIRSSRIGGNVAADGCKSVVLGGGPTNSIFVDGNVHIQRCSGTSGYNAEGLPTVIGGNFVCQNNAGCQAIFGTVSGNVQINDNSGADIWSNNIGGNLQCYGNTSITDAGDPNSNTVAGNKQGQCAGASF